VEETLSTTLTVTNSGLWPSRPVSGALYLSSIHDDPLLPAQHLSIPALGTGAQVTVAEELTLPVSSEDLYRLAVEVDSDGILDEQDEGNNRVEITIPVVVTTTVHPGAAVVLTSNSEHLAFQFPAGTVTTPTEIRLTPRLPSDLPPGPLVGITAFTLAAYRGGQPILTAPHLPITVTWQYTDTDVAGLDEGSLSLYRLLEGNRWQRVSCPAQQRQPEVNRLSTCIWQWGEYVFGQAYKQYLPLVLVTGEGSRSEVQPSTPGVLPGLPLRLPPWAASARRHLPKVQPRQE
jgi:hypothetical protein